MAESIKSLRAILAKSARTDAALEKKGEEKPKSNRVELQYPKIMVPLPKIGTCAGVKKWYGVRKEENGGGKRDVRLVKEVEREKSTETISLRNMSDGGSILSR
jgi:hypothetical protein